MRGAPPSARSRHRAAGPFSGYPAIFALNQPEFRLKAA
ncbi:hypothetical protein OH687_16550 [Burkholderia anthina]|nr:hypothetical protein OH687_16550 [Burkholderia anthina]